MRVRLLVESDASQFWTVRLRALGEHPEAFGEPAAHWEGLSLEQVAGRVSNAASPGSFVLGAFEEDGHVEGALVGTVGFNRSVGEKVQHKGFIWGVYVTPEVRGRNTGKALMEETLARLRRLSGLEQVTLAVVSSNIAARNLYLSLGFQVYGLERRAICVNGVYYDEELMALFMR